MSIFDFEGNCFKVVKTKTAFAFPIALKKNRIAYLNYKFETDNRKSEKKKCVVILKDILSGSEKIIDTIELFNKNSIKFSPNSGMSFPDINGDVFLAKTKDGNLLVGVSNKPEINIYSLEGRRIKSFKLNMVPQSVTKDYIDEYKKSIIDEMKDDPKYSKTAYKLRVTKIEEYDFRKLFEDHLPYYRSIQVDSDGNILIFKYIPCIKECAPIFQVYSPEGKYICETRIDTGIFVLNINTKNKQIEFTDKGIFGLFELKGSDDIDLRLVKVNWK
ncbi:MAG: hypothetical protein ACM3SY_10510 [Candidatus Omnitrophota bacterium]